MPRARADEFREIRPDLVFDEDGDLPLSGVSVSIPTARTQIPNPESTAEYSVTNAVSCG